MTGRTKSYLARECERADRGPDRKPLRHRLERSREIICVFVVGRCLDDLVRPGNGCAGLRLL